MTFWALKGNQMQVNSAFSIGEAVKRLSGEMEISESNLRFWEKEGLLRPQRTPGGHRLYTEEDLARIRLIKELQAKRYIPLDAIKHLFASGLTIQEIRKAIEEGEGFFRPIHYDPNFDLMSRDELLEKTRFAPELLESLEQGGLLLPTVSGEHPVYDEDDLRVIGAYRELVSLGIEASDLETYAHKMAGMIEYQIRMLVERLLEATPPGRFREASERVKALSPEVERYLMRKLTFKVSKRLLDQGFFQPVKERLDAEKGSPSA